MHYGYVVSGDLMTVILCRWLQFIRQEHGKPHFERLGENNIFVTRLSSPQQAVAVVQIVQRVKFY